MHIGARRPALNDQLAVRIHFRLVLAAEVGLFVLLSPSGIAILLPSLGCVTAELDRTLSFPYALVLVAGVALSWRIHKASVHNTFLVSNGPLLFLHFTESSKKTPTPIASIALLCFAEIPHRVCVRNGISRPQAQKGHEAETVSDLLLDSDVAMVVELLQYENLEREHRIEWRVTALAIIAFHITKYVFKVASTAVPIDDLREPTNASAMLIRFSLFLVSDEREEIAGFVLIPVFHRPQPAQNTNGYTHSSRS